MDEHNRSSVDVRKLEQKGDAVMSRNDPEPEYYTEEEQI